MRTQEADGRSTHATNSQQQQQQQQPRTCPPQQITQAGIGRVQAQSRNALTSPRNTAPPHAKIPKRTSLALTDDDALELADALPVALSLMLAVTDDVELFVGV